MSHTAALQRLLKPATLAVFGGADAEEVIRQCRHLGFAGETWAVNPKRREILGVPCYGSVADLPGAPDASFVAAPAGPSVDIVRELSALGAGGAVCFASGFAEVDAAGEALQRALREAAGDMAIVGPNCHGFLNYLDGVALWPDQHGGVRVGEGAAVVLQSGNIGINLTMQQRGLALGYLISVGNAALLGFHDYIDWLLEDPRVTAIGLHIEGLTHAHEFSLAAIKALKKGVGIVVLKTGRSELGAETAMSHTSSLSGSDALYSAFFARLGIARVDTLSEFLETLKFLSVTGVLSGTRIASMSCSGGEASIVADRAELLGLEMPPPSADSKSRLASILGPRVHVANPLDYHTYAWGIYDQLYACFHALLENRYDCTLLVLDYPLTDARGAEHWETTERALIDRSPRHPAARRDRRHAARNATGARAVTPARSRHCPDAGAGRMPGRHACRGDDRTGATRR